MRIFKNFLKAILIILGVLVIALIAYLLYLLFSYSRLPDKIPLEVEGEANSSVMTTDRSYTVVTQNFGFGAYTPDFTFFMDGGKESRAASKESVYATMKEACETLSALEPDFILLQEVDLNSTRSYHIDQYEEFRKYFRGYSSVFAQNYDSAFLMYPVFDPHGASNSGMPTFSNFEITSSLRRSLPITESLAKFLDLDRCYSVTRIAVENGKELILYNVHASAYGGTDEIRKAQLKMLLDDMNAEYQKGNYVICGGDFNQDFTGTSGKDINGDEQKHYMAKPFPAELIPDGFSRCVNYKNGELIPTCRNCDLPYKAGDFADIVDGFIISDNVECLSVENIRTGFAYSDHEPVVLKFKLK